MTVRILDTPLGSQVSEGVAGETAPSTAGLQVQAILAQIMLREAGLTARADPLVVTSQEANVFLARHLRVTRLPVWPPRVRVGPGFIQVAGPASLARLLEGAGAHWLARILPERMLGMSVWVTVSGRIVVQEGRGEFVVDWAALGRQPVPTAWLLGALGGPARAALTWRMPRIVRRVDLEPDRIVIHTVKRG